MPLRQRHPLALRLKRRLDEGELGRGAAKAKPDTAGDGVVRDLGCEQGGQ
jgi:hypothetical protein